MIDRASPACGTLGGCTRGLPVTVIRGGRSQEAAPAGPDGSRTAGRDDGGRAKAPDGRWLTRDHAWRSCWGRARAGSGGTWPMLAGGLVRGGHRVVVVAGPAEHRGGVRVRRGSGPGSARADLRPAAIRVNDLRAVRASGRPRGARRRARPRAAGRGAGRARADRDPGRPGGDPAQRAHRGRCDRRGLRGPGADRRPAGRPGAGGLPRSGGADDRAGRAGMSTAAVVPAPAPAPPGRAGGGAGRSWARATGPSCSRSPGSPSRRAWRPCSTSPPPARPAPGSARGGSVSWSRGRGRCGRSCRARIDGEGLPVRLLGNRDDVPTCSPRAHGRAGAEPVGGAAAERPGGAAGRASRSSPPRWAGSPRWWATPGCWCRTATSARCATRSDGCSPTTASPGAWPRRRPGGAGELPGEERRWRPCWRSTGALRAGGWRQIATCSSRRAVWPERNTADRVA